MSVRRCPDRMVLGSRMKERNVLDYLPRVWGQSHLFVFSGLDGPTDWRRPFVAQTLGEAPGLVLHAGTDPSRDLEIRFGAEIRGIVREGTVGDLRPFVIGPDVLDLEIVIEQGESVGFRLVWLDRMTVVGEGHGDRAVPCLFTNGDFFRLHAVQQADPLIVGRGLALPHTDGGKAIRLEIGGGVGKFAIVWGPDMERAAQAALEYDLASALSDRMRFFEQIKLPATDDREVLRTYVKACAVMKANIETPCGQITSRWSTPDRWPHRRMWLWDSAFNSLGAQHIDPQLGRDCIRAVLAKQRSDGFVPHCMAPDPDRDSKMTQPPLLPWGAWELHSSNPSKAFLREVYPGLSNYVEWDIHNMDRLGTGLLQWQHSGPDSGMDNSPKFDEGPDFDALDLSCFVANECRALNLIAGELGMTHEAERWIRINSRLARAINDRLWHEDDGFYYGRRRDGSWVRIKTVDGFLPLFSGVATKQRAALLVRHLTCRDEFWPAFPAPSVALDEPKFELDMWRGPTWVNYNWLVVCGLREYGYVERARQLIDLTIGEISKWRAKKGSIYEFYDPFGERAPQDLKRKGKVRRWTGDGIPVIAEYFWSAAVLAHMVVDRFGHCGSSQSPQAPGA